MQPYYEDTRAGITIYLGDCRDVLPGLRGVDAIVTDPPYPLVLGGMTTSIHPGSYFAERAIYDDKGCMYPTPPLSSWAPLLAATGENVEAMVFTNDRNLPDTWAAFQAAKWRWHNLLVWDKGNKIQNMYYMKQCEYILYLFHGNTRPMTHMGRSNLVSFPMARNREHDSEKPVALLRWLMSNHDWPLVVDPFMGSGTTLRAAKDLGRRAIGIEVDERYAEIAVRRLQQEVMALC